MSTPSQLENGTASGPQDNVSDKGGQPMLVRSATPGGHPVDDSYRALPQYHRKLADPTPLGLCAFATTLFLLSLVNVNTQGLVGKTNFITCMGVAYGGIVLLLSGMWSFAAGNTFAAMAFSSYGGFWLSYSIMQIPWFNVTAGYTEEELASMIGLYLAAWTMFSFFLLIASIRSNVSMVALFVFVVIALACLTAASFTGNATTQKAGGIFGLISAFVGYWTGLAALYTPETVYFSLPVGDISRQGK